MYINFEHIVENARRELNNNSLLIVYLKNDIERAKGYISKYILSNPEISNEEIKFGIIDFLYSETKKFSKLSNLSENIYERTALEEVTKRGSNFLKAKYKELSLMDDNHIENELLSSDLERNIDITITKMINTIRETKENMSDEEYKIINSYLSGDKTIVEAVKKVMKTLSNSDRKKYQLRINCISKNEEEFLPEFLEEYKESQEIELKNKYINLLSFLGDFFKNMGLLDQYSKLYNSALIRNGLSKLTHTDDKYYTEIFDQEYLKNLDIDDLEMLTVFWINRFTKESDQLNNGIFAIISTDSEKKIKNNEDFNFSEDKLSEIYTKIQVLQCVAKRVTDMALSKVKGQEIKNEISVEDEIDEIGMEISHKYANEFSNESGQKDYGLYNKDTAMFIPLTSNNTNSYFQKDAILITEIYKFMTSKKIKNWGFMEADRYNTAIGIDYEGFNRTISLHLKNNYLMDFFDTNNLEPIIPIFTGRDDMYISMPSKGKMMKKQRINCHVLRPATQEDKRNIREMLDSGDYKGDSLNFLEHLRFLSNDKKFPSHLMQKKIDKKGNVTLVHPSTKYINLLTGDIYQTTTTGEFEKIGDMENDGKDRRID